MWSHLARTTNDTKLTVSGGERCVMYCMCVCACVCVWCTSVCMCTIALFNVASSLDVPFTGLIFSLFNVASSLDVPFWQPLQFQCFHHGSTRACLCSPLYSIPFSATTSVTICGMSLMVSVWDLSKCSAHRGASYAFLAWNITQSAQSSCVVIHHDRAMHPLLN